MIPQIFHQIWLGPNQMPAEHLEYRESWKCLHPKWEMRLWTEEHLPKLENIREFESAPSLAGKANVLRYEILKRFGGVYIDTDFECLRPIDGLIDGIDAFAGAMQNGIINNAIIGSTPGHPLLQDAVRCLPGYVLTHWNKNSYAQTGPGFLTALITRRQTDTTVFPWESFYPYTFEDKHVYKKAFVAENFPHAYGVHHWQLSWRQQSG